jgi:acyl carrier protein
MTPPADGRVGDLPDREAVDPVSRISRAVDDAIQTVYRDSGRPPRGILPHALLGSDLGLDSLDLAQVIVLLERSLDVDPFRTLRPGGTPIRTVGNLVAIYAAALGPSGAAE